MHRPAALLCLIFLFAVCAAAHETPCTATATPSVMICTPTNEATVSSPVRIIADANSSGEVNLVQVWIDGVKKFQAASHDVDTSLAIPVGRRRLTVQAKDTNGATFKQTIFINVVSSGSDCAQPAADRSVNICQPPPDGTVSSPVTVQATARSSSGVRLSQVYIDGVKKFETPGASVNTDISMPAGNRRLTVQAKDNADATFKKTIFINVNSTATVPFKVEVFKSGLEFPVSMAFLPDGRMLFNELKTGKIRVIEDGVLRPQAWATLTVSTQGEQGLIGLAVDPSFASNRHVYVFHSDPGGFNRVVRFTDSGGVGTNRQLIVGGLPMANFHNAGNIGIGRDGKLYISIGDNTNPANSQSTSSRAGKILRYNRDGSVPTDNPFGASNAVFARGLRNSFDFAFHPSAGTIYATENGPDCDDELNRIVRGGNYGWRPQYPCGDADSRFVAPIRRFNPVIAPTGATFYTKTVFPQFTGNLFVVDFNTGRVRRFVVDESNAGRITSSQIVVDGSFGDLLDVIQGPDGYIYFSSPTAIMRIVPR